MGVLEESISSIMFTFKRAPVEGQLEDTCWQSSKIGLELYCLLLYVVTLCWIPLFPGSSYVTERRASTCPPTLALI